MHDPAHAIKGAIALLILFCRADGTLAVQGGSGDTPTTPFRLKWVSDLGAESVTATAPESEIENHLVIASVPGAVYAFALGKDGALVKVSRVASDSSIPYGRAVAGNDVVVAHDDGSVSLWSFRHDGPATLRWHRLLDDRAISVAWDGGERVFIASRANRLVAAAANDGRVLWSTGINGKAEGPAVADGGYVFIATKSGELLRLDAGTGALRWKTALPGPAIHPPVLAGKEARLLVCGTWNGHLLAYNLSSGQLAWSTSMPERLAGPSLAGEDFVAAVTSDGAVHCFDLTGQPMWTAPAAAKGTADLFFHRSNGARPRLVVASNILTALDVGTGDRLDDYPRGAVDDLKRRFLTAMMEGERTYSEREKEAVLEGEAFPIVGTLFGEVRDFGGSLAMGTEEGWVYVFDAASLRPLSRYRAGLAWSIPPRLAGDTVVVAAGEEVFGLDPSTGRLRWRRSFGAAVEQIEGDSQLGVLAGGRLSVLSASTGTRQWSAREELRSICAPPGGPSLPWLAAEDGSIRAYDSSGHPLEAPWTSDGELLPVVAQDGSWAAATRAGKVLGLKWRADRLIQTWEIVVEGPITGIKPAGQRVLVLSQAGYLVGVEEGQEVWRSRLPAGKDCRLTALGSAVLVQSGDELTVYDVTSGQTILSREISTPAVGATLKEGRLVWLDSSGRAHRVSMAGEPAVESSELGVPLEQAWPVAGGFLVGTSAGEVGFVEYADMSPPTGESSVKD